MKKMVFGMSMKTLFPNKSRLQILSIALSASHNKLLLRKIYSLSLLNFRRAMRYAINHK